MDQNPFREHESLEESIQLRNVAIACIRERRRLLVVLKANVILLQSQGAFDDALMSLRDLEPASRDICNALSREVSFP